MYFYIIVYVHNIIQQNIFIQSYKILNLLYKSILVQGCICIYREVKWYIGKYKSLSIEI